MGASRDKYDESNAMMKLTEAVDESWSKIDDEGLQMSFLKAG